MKFRVERDVLADAAAWVARSLPARPPVPVLGGVLIEALDDGDRLTVSGFDYETSARVELDATVGDPGRMLVSGRLLADITRALPSKPVDVVVDGSRATIHCGSSRFSLPTMPVEDYPQLPAMPQLAGSVPADQLAQAVAQVAVASGRDDTLPMLTGIRLEIEGSRLTLAATDRFRLAVRELEWNPGPDMLDVSSAVLIPARTLAEVAKTLAGAGTVELALSAGDGMLGMTGGGRRATTRLLDAEFPRFRQLIPAEHTSAAVVEVAPLVEAIKRVALVTDRVAQVRMEFGEDGLRLTAGGDEAGSAEEELLAELDGAALTIAFNPNYLLDSLGALHTTRAQLTFTTPNRPALVRPVPEPAGEEPAAENADAPDPVPGYLHLLMPVRLPG